MSKKGYYLNIERIKLRAEREKISNKINELDEALNGLEDEFDRIDRIFWSAFLVLVVFAFIVGGSL
tara:strand:+ start:32943 stop:33140 length:198 start_codon:yes stop_codon:yes gene_type:complete